ERWPQSATEKSYLTDPQGQCLTDERHCAPRPLKELVQRAQRELGIIDAILLMPQAAVYFRSDSVTADDYLHISWDDVFLRGTDEAAALALFLLHHESYQLQQTSSQDQSEPKTSTNEIESRLFSLDRDHSHQLTKDLYQQFQIALEVLINERLRVDRNLTEQLLLGDEIQLQNLFRQGLFVLYRILFILYAEAKKFLPVDDSRYRDFYSMEHLRTVAINIDPDLPESAESSYLWESIHSLFTLLERGTQWPGAVEVTAFNGQLFDPNQCPLFQVKPLLSDRALSQVIRTLTFLEDRFGKKRRALRFDNLGIEQLGSIYEVILSNHPRIASKNSNWYQIDRNQVRLLTLKEAQSFPQKLNPLPPHLLKDFINPKRPIFQPKEGVFYLDEGGLDRKNSASYYTPRKLTEFVVERTLKPLVTGKSSQEILSLRILEPAVGSGGFLIAAIRFLAKHLVEARKRETVLHHWDKTEKETSYQLQKAKQDILEHCVFGVDLNPLSLELCRTSLYLETIVPGKPLPFLDHHFKCGNSLIGADLSGKTTATRLELGSIPSIFDLPIDEIFQLNPFQKAHGWIAENKLKEWKHEWITRRKQLNQEWKNIAEEEWIAWGLQMTEQLHALRSKWEQLWSQFPKDQKTPEHVFQYQKYYQQTHQSIDDQPLANPYTRLKTLGDLWCSFWFWPIDLWKQFPSFEQFRDLVTFILKETPYKKLKPEWKQIIEISQNIAKKHRFFHWAIEFPTIFNGTQQGFDAVLSNPPWKVIEFEENDALLSFDPTLASLKEKDKKRRIESLKKQNLAALEQIYREQFVFTQQLSQFLPQTLPEYNFKGKKDLCQFFVMNTFNSWTNPRGTSGFITSYDPIFTNQTIKDFREKILNNGNIKELFVFINQNKIFPIHRCIMFSVLTLINSKTTKKQIPIAYPVTKLIDLDYISALIDNSQAQELTKNTLVKTIDPELIRLIAPDTFTVPLISNPLIL
ncbi:MAG: N-6 DNA methylase, partial [Pseudobdellovibrionaceae bacterium]|nr:N-6 DNA methylase [Pseudobdellovibrionaceae bacterium]